MTEPSIKFWSDILQAIDEIEGFVRGMDKFNAYVSDLRTKRAVERSLAIIGEAVRHLQRLEQDLALDDAKYIVGMRNRLIHSYDNVDDKLVRQVVKQDLPKLKTVAIAHLPTP